MSSNEQLTSKRQQEILDAAIKVFSRKGFNGATTREIAHEAGVAEGTIFRYFKSKKDILLSLVSPHIVNSLAETIEEAGGASDETILKAVLRNRFDLIKKNLDLVRLIFTEAQFHPEIMDYIRKNVILKAAGVLEEFIRKKVQSESFKNIDPQIAVRIFAGMGGIFILWNEYLFADSDLKFDEDAVIEAIVDIFLNGIRNREGER